MATSPHRRMAACLLVSQYRRHRTVVICVRRLANPRLISVLSSDRFSRRGWKSIRITHQHERSPVVRVGVGMIVARAGGHVQCRALPVSASSPFDRASPRDRLAASLATSSPVSLRNPAFCLGQPRPWRAVAKARGVAQQAGIEPLHQEGRRRIVHLPQRQADARVPTSKCL